MTTKARNRLLAYTAVRARRPGDLLSRDRDHLHRLAAPRRLAAGRRDRRDHGRDRRLVRAAAAQARMGRTGPPGPVKRFWKDVAVEPEGAAGRSSSTAGRCNAGARRAAACRPRRWPRRSPRNGARSKATIDPRAMPLTGLANAAIDRVAPDRDGVRARAGALRARPISPATAPKGPRGAGRACRRCWDRAARLGAAALRRRFRDDARALMHVAAAAGDGRAAGHAVAALEPFHLAGLSPLVTIGGSLVAALARARGRDHAGAGVGRGQRRRALADRAMGRGCRGRSGDRKPPPRLPGRGASSWSCSD